jgi:hypothetical protein
MISWSCAVHISVPMSQALILLSFRCDLRRYFWGTAWIEIFVAFYRSCQVGERIQPGNKKQDLLCSTAGIKCVFLYRIEWQSIMRPSTQRILKLIQKTKQRNAQFSKLIFNFCCLFHVSNLVGSSSGRQLCMQYGMFSMLTPMHVKLAILHTQLSPWGWNQEVRNMKEETEIKY